MMTPLLPYDTKVTDYLNPNHNHVVGVVPSDGNIQNLGINSLRSGLNRIGVNTIAMSEDAGNDSMLRGDFHASVANFKQHLPTQPGMEQSLGLDFKPGQTP